MYFNIHFQYNSAEEFHKFINNCTNFCHCHCHCVYKKVQKKTCLFHNLRETVRTFSPNAFFAGCSLSNHFSTSRCRMKLPHIIQSIGLAVIVFCPSNNFWKFNTCLGKSEQPRVSARTPSTNTPGSGQQTK